MSQQSANAISIPSKQQVQLAVKENPNYTNETQIKAIVQQSLAQLTAIENRLDRLENKGAIRRVVDIVTGTTQREMIALLRDLTQTQQTTIKLVLTLAVYHAENVAVMNEILRELGQAKGVNVRTASHIEFLYDQVELIRDRHVAQRNTKRRSAVIWSGATALIIIAGIVVYMLSVS